jgi:hypothetical protein
MIDAAELPEIAARLSRRSAMKCAAQRLGACRRRPRCWVSVQGVARPGDPRRQCISLFLRRFQLLPDRSNVRGSAAPCNFSSPSSRLLVYSRCSNGPTPFRLANKHSFKSLSINSNYFTWTSTTLAENIGFENMSGKPSVHDVYSLQNAKRALKTLQNMSPSPILDL